MYDSSLCNSRPIGKADVWGVDLSSPKPAVTAVVPVTVPVLLTEQRDLRLVRRLADNLHQLGPKRARRERDQVRRHGRGHRRRLVHQDV